MQPDDQNIQNAQAQKQKDFTRTYQQANRKLEEEMAARRAVELGVPYMDLTSFPVGLEPAVISKPQAKDAESAVFFKDGNDVRIGTLNPSNVALAQYIVNFKIQQLRPTVYLISKSSFAHLLELDNKVPEPKPVEDDVVRVVVEQDYAKDLARLADASQQFTATQILSILLGAAQQYGSSDIHLEPEASFVKARFRMDGVLQDRCHIPSSLQKILTSRIKVV